LVGTRRMIGVPHVCVQAWEASSMSELRLVAADTEGSDPLELLESHVLALSIDEVATVLRVNRKTVVAMIERGELREVRYARRRWVPTHVLRSFLLLDGPGEASFAGSSSS
jgi:excisionase family DNA binding protein